MYKNNYSIIVIRAYNNRIITYLHHNNLYIRIVLKIFIIYAVIKSPERLSREKIDIIRIVIPNGNLIKKRGKHWHWNKLFKRSLKDGIKHKVMDTNK